MAYKDKEKQKATRKAYRQTPHGKEMERARYLRYRNKYKDNPEYKERRQKAWRNTYAKLRAKMFEVYGEVCACCGESNKKFLTLDHIYDDGYLDRNKNGGGCNVLRNATTYINRDRFQILCWNCNSGRAMNGGVCPHVEEREKAGKG